MDDDIRSRLRGGGRGFRSERPSAAYRPTPRPAPEIRQDPWPTPAPKPPKPVKPPKPPKAPKVKRPHKKRKKLKTFLIILVLLAAAAAGAYWFYKRQIQQAAVKKDQTITKAAEELGEIKPTGTIRFIATGDNFTFESINNAAKKADGSYDYSPFYAQMKPFFDKNKADIRLCNESVPTGGTTIGISGFPNFNAPPAFAKALGDLGCNVINMGTAHINDKGQQAVDSTVSYWDNQPDLLAAAGANRSAAEQNKIRYFTVKNIKFAFLAYTTSTNVPQSSPHTINAYSDAVAATQVAEARKNAQFTIVSINWGKEDSGDITPEQDHIAQHLAFLNADVVIGTGTHVLQPAKILDSQDKKHQTLVWYSLGNFLNSQVPVDNLIGGIAVMNIDVATQNIQDPKFLPVYMHYEWTAEQKARAGQADLLARRNFSLLPLDKSAEALAKSQNKTTVAALTDKVKGIMTKFAPIKVITSAEY